MAAMPDTFATRTATSGKSYGTRPTFPPAIRGEPHGQSSFFRGYGGDGIDHLSCEIDVGVLPRSRQRSAGAPCSVPPDVSLRSLARALADSSNPSAQPGIAPRDLVSFWMAAWKLQAESRSRPICVYPVPGPGQAPESGAEEGVSRDAATRFITTSGGDSI
jgi:hypothetical protein